jgi:hypothetical protein
MHMAACSLQGCRVPDFSHITFLCPTQPEYWPKGLGGYDFTTRQFTPGWDAFIAYYAELARRLTKANPNYPILGLSWCVR